MAQRATRKDIAWGASLILLAILGYEIINHIGRSTLIDLSTDFDRAMPLVPVFVVPYLSFIPLVFIVLPLLALRSALIFRAYSLSLFASQMIMNALYLLVPATVVRPVLESTDVFSVLLRDLVWKLDEPLNTFPSNHVTFSVIAILTLSSLKLERWWVLPLQVWFGLVCFSTLLVYQHVIVDLISGVLIGSVVYLVTSRRMSSAKAKIRA